MNVTKKVEQDAAMHVEHVIQGEFSVSDDPTIVFSTLLGSCVATCLCDPIAGVGGMNHFLLAQADPSSHVSRRYGLHAMELLVNGLLKMGARRDRLQAKLFGGAMMHDGLGKIGQANADFAMEFLRAEGISCKSQSLGGQIARRIRFVPTTGQAQQLLLQDAAPPPVQRSKRPEISRPTDDDVTFF